MSELLKLSEIRIDGGTQPRTEIDYELVDEYAESIDSLPAITVFSDGASYWLVDGFHRYFAHKKANRETINCEVRSGSLREASFIFCGSNANHGKRRTNEDKRKAVMTLITDEEWCLWSNRKIAEICCVDEKTVRNCIEANCGKSADTEKKCKRNGKQYTVDTSNIGKKTHCWHC